jgi:hypothetical protein
METKKDKHKALQQALEQYSELKEQHPDTLEAIFFLTQPELFRHEDSIHIKEISLSKYQTSRHPLDVQFYKRLSRIIPTEQLKNLPSQDEI